MTERRPSLSFAFGRSMSIGSGMGDDQKQPRKSRRGSVHNNFGRAVARANPNDSKEARRCSAPADPQMGRGQKRRASLGRALSFGKIEVPDDKVDGTTLYEAGMKKAKAQDWETAIRLLNRALIAQRKSFGQDHPTVASTLNSIGVALTNLGETFGAMTAFQEALYIRQETLGAGHEDVVKTMNNIHKLLDVVQLIEDDDDESSDEEDSEDDSVDYVERLRAIRTDDDESSDEENSEDDSVEFDERFRAIHVHPLKKPAMSSDSDNESVNEPGEKKTS